jgi:hypothetical protein
MDCNGETAIVIRSAALTISAVDSKNPHTHS